MQKMLSIANVYGNVDCRLGRPLPGRYVHVRGDRLQPLCRKLKISFAPALVGFTGKKRYGYKPETDGVVVTARSAPKLLTAIAERERRTASPEARARATRATEKRKAKRQEQDEALWERGIDPSGHTAKWVRRGDLDHDAGELVAWKAGYRHEHTDYEQLLQDYRGQDGAREDAREMATEQPIPSTWGEYLRLYDFPSAEIAEALAATLRDPQRSHPIWFCEAVIAVRRAGLSLDGLTYEAIQDAISTWRSERYDD